MDRADRDYDIDFHFDGRPRVDMCAPPSDPHDPLLIRLREYHDINDIIDLTAMLVKEK